MQNNRNIDNYNLLGILFDILYNYIQYQFLQIKIKIRQNIYMVITKLIGIRLRSKYEINIISIYDIFFINNIIA